MRDVLKSTRRWRYAGWLLPFVMLALPNCFLDATGTVRPDEFEPGDAPLTGGIMCDIPKVVELGADGDCADENDIANGIPIEHAAVALAEGVSSSLRLDFSPAATSVCGGPKVAQMQGPFPDGLSICLNCDQQIPAKFANPTAACVAKCIDLIWEGGIHPDDGAETFCQNNVRVSVNLDQNTCIEGACSEGGTLSSTFTDPRRAQEDVVWTDLSGDATADGTNVSKLTGVPGAFDSGARSEQYIAHGDAWVEFAANENGVSHVVGVSHDDGSPDVPGLEDVQFSISLNFDNSVYLVEDNASVILGPFPAYTPGERFRIRITDNNDGTASISYFRLVGPCMQGTVCNQTEIGPQTSPNPSYPLRIQATFREPGATIANATMVRIKETP